MYFSCVSLTSANLTWPWVLEVYSVRGVVIPMMPTWTEEPSEACAVTRWYGFTSAARSALPWASMLALSTGNAPPTALMYRTRLSGP